MPSARTRQKFSLEDVWDLEDQFTALAGSASGVQASASPLFADRVQKEETRVRELTTIEITAPASQVL
jgi:hypothetical protein